MAHSIFLQAHFINLTHWPTFLTGTLPYFPSSCFLTSMYWGLKAHNTPSTALFPAEKNAEMFLWCPGAGSFFPNPPAELQASTLNYHLWLIQLLTATAVLWFGSKSPKGIIFPLNPRITSPVWVIHGIQVTWAAVRHILSAQDPPGTSFNVHFSMFSPQTGSVIAPNPKTCLCCSRKFSISHAHIPAHSCKGCPTPPLLKLVKSGIS